MNFSLLFITIILGFSTIVFSNNENFLSYDYVYQKFVRARSYENIQEMKEVIRLIEDNLQNIKNPNIYEFKTLLAESYLQLGIFTNGKVKQGYIEKALKLSEEILKVQGGNGKAYYVAALASSQLIEFVNVFQKLSLLNKFDDYILKALECLKDDIYIGLAYIGIAVRYMSPPWPFYDLSKSEIYFKEAQKYMYDYSGLYLNWGYLYLKMNNKTKAIEMFEKVLAMEPNEMFYRAHERNVLLAQVELQRLKK